MVLNKTSLAKYGGFAIGILGMAAFLGGALLCIFGSRDPQFMEDFCLPISDPQDVVADIEGNVYVALAFYGRVQIYDRNGIFQRGVFVDAGGGSLCLNLDEHGMLQIISAKQCKMNTIDRNGVVLKSEELTHVAVNAFFDRAEQGWISRDGSEYSLTNTLIYPGVVRTTPNGSTTLINTPIYLYPFTGPIPCFVLCLCGFLLGAAFQRQEWRTRSRAIGKGHEVNEFGT